MKWTVQEGAGCVRVAAPGWGLVLELWRYRGRSLAFWLHGPRARVLVALEPARA